MKKNKLIYVILILVFYSIIFSTVIFAQNNSIDFGSLKYIPGHNLESHNLVKMQLLVIPLKNNNLEHFEVRLQDSFKSETGKRELPQNRLKIKTNTGSYIMEDSNISLPVTADDLVKYDDGFAFLAEILISVESVDLPGRYHNQLVITQFDSAGKLTETVLPVKFKVEPWLDMRIEHNSPRIFETNTGDNRLSTSYPGLIEISGNVPWQLYITGIKNEITSNKDLVLSANTNDERIEIRENNLTLTDNQVLIASTEITNNYSQDKFKIDYDFFIKDYTNIRAGKISLPVIFRLEPRNN